MKSYALNRPKLKTTLEFSKVSESIFLQVFKNEDERISVDADTKHYGSIDKTAVDVGHDTVVPNGDFGKLDNAHTQEKDIYQPGIYILIITEDVCFHRRR